MEEKDVIKKVLEMQTTQCHSLLQDVARESGYACHNEKGGTAIVVFHAFREHGCNDMKDFLKTRAPLVWILGISAAYTLLLWMYRDFTPFYDGGIYYQRVLELVTGEFNWLEFHLERHISPIYSLFLAWSQLIDQGNLIPMYATNMALVIFATFMFYKLLDHLFGKHSSRAELMLVASIYPAMPVLTVHLFHFNLDIGLTVFFIPYVYFLLKGRLWWAALFGVCMMLSKEPGVLIYLIIAALYSVIYIARPAKSLKGAFRNVQKRYVAYVPGVVFAIYYAIVKFGGIMQEAAWGTEKVDSHVFHLLTDFNLADKTIQSFLADIFILNFNWLPTLAIILFLVRKSFHWSTGSDKKETSVLRSADALFLILLFIGLVYVVTRFRAWNNARYVLVSYPALLLIAYCSLRMLISSTRMRMVSISITLLLIISANWSTFDPVSKAVFGTIPFGRHAWLDMASLMGQAGTARDQQAYNLEFLELHYAMHEALKNIRPPNDSVFLGGPFSDYYYTNRYIPETYQPTYRQKNAAWLRVIDNPDLMVPNELTPLIGNQPNIWFLALPNLYNDTYMRIITEHYRVRNIRTYGRRGYSIGVVTFDRDPIN
jgi:hypothetical protein